MRTVIDEPEAKAVAIELARRYKVMADVCYELADMLEGLPVSIDGGMSSERLRQKLTARAGEVRNSGKEIEYLAHKVCYNTNSHLLEELDSLVAQGI